MSSDDTEGLVDQVVPGFLSSVQNPRVPLPPSVLLRRRHAGGGVMAGLTTAPRFLLVSKVLEMTAMSVVSSIPRWQRAPKRQLCSRLLTPAFVRKLKIHGSLLSLNTTPQNIEKF